MVRAVERLEQGSEDRSRRTMVCKVEERPRALAVTLDEPGLHKELEVPRDARLRLPEDVGEVGHGELTLAQQGEHAEASLLGSRPQHRQDLVEIGRARFGHVSPQKQI